jgi:hypothetical protein
MVGDEFSLFPIHGASSILASLLIVVAAARQDRRSDFDTYTNSHRDPTIIFPVLRRNWPVAMPVSC